MTADTLPPFCELRGWIVFRAGRHRAGAFYSPADVRRIPLNFARLSAGADEAAVPLVAKATIGHDRKQRYARSLGFPRLGRVVACRLTPEGAVAVDVAGVPTPVGAAVNAGLLDSGSVELADGFPDPADPGLTVPGPILAGVALLGEEQPAVKGFPPPRAVFADGTPVPPTADPAPWLAALTAALRPRPADGATDDFATADGRRLVFHRILFSEFVPMRDQLLTDLRPFGIDAAADPAFAGMTDDQLQAALAAARRAPAADGEAPPWARKLLADVSGCVQRVGSLEAAHGDRARADDADRAAAFAQMSEAAVGQAIREGRLLPRDRSRFVEEGARVLSTRSFAAVSGDRAAAFEAWKADLASRPATALFSDALADGPATPGAKTAHPVAHLLRHTPQGRDVLRKRAGRG